MTEHPSLEHNRRASRNAKRRRTGTCEDCGATTRYNGHAVAVSRLCLRCAAKRNGLARRGTGQRAEQLLALLERGPMRFTEIHTALGISKQNMGWLVGRLLEYGLIERPSRGLCRKVAA